MFCCAKILFLVSLLFVAVKDQSLLTFNLVCLLFMHKCIEQNFGGEKTLANLANRHNSSSFFANIPDEARGHAVCVVNIRHVKQGT